MKGIKLTKRLTTLGSRGVTHLLVPLLLIFGVATIGTYAVVSSHALTNTPGGTAAPSTSKAKAKPVAAKKPAASKNGYLVIYSESGRYDSVKIVGANIGGALNCGGALTPGNNSVTKTLPTPPKGGTVRTLEFKCSPIGGVEQYNIYFGKHKVFTSRFVAVDTDAGYCTIVHPDGAQTKVAASVGGKCAGQTDPPTKIDVSFNVLPSLTSNKKGISGYIDVYAPNEDLTRVECTGQVSVTYQEGSKSYTYNNPLKYSKNKGVTNGYCAAIINADGQTPKGFIHTGATYKITAHYAGSIFFNPPADVNASIPIPALTANKAST